MAISSLQAGDPREPLVTEVFSHLCEAVMREEADTLAAERRLWRLPEVAVYFVFNVVTSDDRRNVDPIVHRLRSEVGEIINQRFDRSSTKLALAKRVEQANTEFVLRPWQFDDIPRFVWLLDDEKLWDGLPEDYPGSITEDLARNLIEISNGWPDRHIVHAVEWRGHPIGQVRLQFDSSPYPDSAEISYWIGGSYWGQGLATQFVTLFTAESFNQHPDLQRIFAQVADDNVASMRVLEKSGYRREWNKCQNVTKHDRRVSIDLFGVCRADYTFSHLAEPADAGLLKPASHLVEKSFLNLGWLVACDELLLALEGVPAFFQSLQSVL